MTDNYEIDENSNEYKDFMGLNKTDQFGLHVCVHPINDATGCGIIVKVEPMSEEMLAMMERSKFDTTDKNLYTVLTDFGNEFRLTREELETMYRPTKVELDLEARFLRQVENISEALRKYTNYNL